MQEGGIVFSLLLPTDENTPKTVHPTMRSLHYPTPCPFASFSLQHLGFLAARTNGFRKAKFLDRVTYFLVIVTLVHAHALWFLFGWFWTVNHNALDGFTYQFHVIAIGPFDSEADGHTIPFGQQAAFRPFFPRSVGFAPVSSPPRGALVIAPSILNQSQSMPFNSSKRSTPTFQSFKNTPASTHS